VYKLLTILLVFAGCEIEMKSDARIYVVQEIKLSDNESFFWFRNEHELAHEGLSYFQFADEKCKLSIDAANAYCSLPEQIFEVRNDTVFILVRSEIKKINEPEKYKIEIVEYEHALF